MRSLAIAAIVAAGAGPAAAYPSGNQFDSDPLATDGAGGIPFTGAPRWTGHTCVVCHTNAPGLISLEIEAKPPDLFTTGWVANTQYEMRVVLLDAHEAVPYQMLGNNCGFGTSPYVACEDSGFALEMDDPNARPVGTFALFDGSAGACASGSAFLPDADAYILNDGTAVTHSGANHGQLEWSFCWTAPAAGAGTIDAYGAVVNGGSGDGSAFPDTPYGDDVFAGVLAIPEQGAAAPPPESGSCTAGARGAPGDLALAAALGLALVLRRSSRRSSRRRRRAAALAAVAMLAAGCTHVRPTQREVLSRKNMVFGPDPLEDELDLHMQEAREGSAGGYGSSGGGCGCN